MFGRFFFFCLAKGPFSFSERWWFGCFIFRGLNILVLVNVCFTPCQLSVEFVNVGGGIWLWIPVLSSWLSLSTGKSLLGLRLFATSCGRLGTSLFGLLHARIRLLVVMLEWGLLVLVVPPTLPTGFGGVVHLFVVFGYQGARVLLSHLHTHSCLTSCTEWRVAQHSAVCDRTRVHWLVSLTSSTCLTQSLEGTQVECVFLGLQIHVQSSLCSLTTWSLHTNEHRFCALRELVRNPVYRASQSSEYTEPTA